MNLRGDWQRGRHSDIPRCCIVWFLVRSTLRWYRLTYQWQWYRSWHYRTAAGRPRERGYVRCPACWLRGRWATVHECSEACAGQVGASTSYRTAGLVTVYER